MVACPAFRQPLPGSARPMKERQSLHLAAGFPVVAIRKIIETLLTAQALAHSSANHSRHCSAVQAAFSSMMGLALGRLRRFSTVNRGGSGIVWAVSQ